MKKTICLVIAVLVLLLASTLQEYACGVQPYYGGGTYMGGGAHYGGGYYYRGGPYYGGGHYYRRGPYYGPGIWIGPGWGPWWWGAPYYPYYPYYSEPVVIQQQPSVYVQPTPQQEEQSYWYYCPNPQGYYPYVKQCPKGWMKVVPSPVPQDGGE